MQNTHKKNYTGFTFVEVMAVIAIMGIMTAVVMVSLSSTKSNAKLRAAQREVASAIKLAQSYALQGKQPSNGDNPCGYGIKFISNNTYNIFYNKFAGDTCSVYTYSAIDSVREQGFELPIGTALDSPALNQTALFFTIPHGNMYDFNESLFNYAPGTGVQWTFKVGTDSKSITIYPSGTISEY